MRWGPRVSALGPHGECAGVPGEVLQGHRPPARTPCTGKKALLGRGHSRKPRVRKHLEVSDEPRKTVQQMFSSQRVVRQGLRAFHGRHCWTLGRPVLGASAPCGVTPNTVEHTMLAPSRKGICGRPRVLPTFRGPGAPRGRIWRRASARATLPLGGAGETVAGRAPVKPTVESGDPASGPGQCNRDQPDYSFRTSRGLVPRHGGTTRRRGRIREPRAQPWVGSDRSGRSPERARYAASPARVSRPFRAWIVCSARSPRAAPWAVVSRPFRAADVASFVRLLASRPLGGIMVGDCSGRAA